MNQIFSTISLESAYKLITPGLPVLIATKGMHYNFAPIAWNTPLDYEPVTKLLFVCDPAHQTAINIHKTGHFAVCIPQNADDMIIEQ